MQVSCLYCKYWSYINNYPFSSECIELRDPHCAWDQLKNLCVSVDAVTSFRYLVQDVARGNGSKCKASTNEKAPRKEVDDDNTITSNLIDEEEPSSSVKELSLQIENRAQFDDCSNDINADIRTGCSQIKKSEFTSGTLWWGIVVAAMIGLFVGFVGGYCVSRKFYMQYPNTPFIEQHNHLDRSVLKGGNVFVRSPFCLECKSSYF